MNATIKIITLLTLLISYTMFGCNIYLTFLASIALFIYAIIQKKSLFDIYLYSSCVIFQFFFAFNKYTDIKLYSISDEIINTVSNDLYFLVVISIIFDLLTKFSDYLVTKLYIKQTYIKRMSINANKIQLQSIIWCSLCLIQIIMVYKFGYNSRITIIEQYPYLPYIKFILIGFTISIIDFNSYSNDNKNYLLLFLLIIFWTSELIMGARREFIFIFIYIMSVFYYKNKLSILKIIPAIFFIFCIASIAIFRNNNINGLNQLMVDFFGEFMFPIQTLLYSKESGKFGEIYTIFNLFIYYLPRDLTTFNGSMAQLISGEMTPPSATWTMGYAFTPLTDLALSFGKFYIILYAPTLYALLFAAKSFFHISTPFLLASLLNFCRSEFATFVFEIAIVWIAKLIYSYIFIQKSFYKRTILHDNYNI